MPREIQKSRSRPVTRRWAMGAAASVVAVLLTTCKLDKLISKPPSAVALTVAPGRVRVSVSKGSSVPQLDNLMLANTGSGTLSWNVSDSGGSWLDVTPRSGRTPAQVQVQLNPAGLDAGEYHGVIVVSAAQAVGSPARVPVDLVVAAGTPPPATHLGFSIPPGNTQVGATITPAVKVSALDASENRVTSFSGAITLALSANPGGGTVSGGGSVNAVNGAATFAGLSIDKAGNGYTLTATSGQLADATSDPFDITTAPPPPPPPPPPNHAPSVSVSGGSVLVGILYQLSASFTDQDGDGPWSYSIDWGNGSESGSTSSQGAITASHTYLVPGSYLIRVTVTDSHGLSGSGEATLTVGL